MDKQRLIGILYVLIGAILWGIAGTVGQRLLQGEGIPVDWLVALRLTISGSLLLVVALFSKHRKLVFQVWRDLRSTLSLLVFSIFGMLAVQYTFMVSIELGNAAVATLLQYQAPVFIFIYLVIRRMTVINARDIFAIILAVTGTFLLLTNGSIHELAVPIPSVVWGLISGVTLAFYTLYAAHLIKKWGSLIVIGWSMVIGGTCLAIYHPPWNIDTTGWTMDTGLLLLFIVIFGTMIAFWFYVESLRFLKPAETTLLGTVEPLTAVFSSVIWLKISFGELQLLGMILILLMVVYLAVFKDKRKDIPQSVAHDRATL